MKTSRQINAERKKAGLPPLNFPLFRKVIKKLETAPEAYRQTTTASRDNSAPCGTAACIGGWADILSGAGDLKKARVSLNRAADRLGLNGMMWAEEDDTERAILFDGDPSDVWPQPFASQWSRAHTRERRARVAIRYLKRIITTGKVLE